MNKITKLTSSQQQRVIEIIDEWFAIQTQWNEAAARDAVLGMWTQLGKAPPLVLFFDSPLACCIVGATLKDLKPAKESLHSRLNWQLSSQLDSQLYWQLRSQLDSQLESQLSSQLSSQLYSQLDSQLHSQLSSQLRSQLESQLYSQLRSQLDSQLYWQLRSQLDSQLESQLSSQLSSQLYSQLDSQLHSQLDSQLDSQLRSQLSSQLDSQLHSQLSSQPWYITAWWGFWCAYHSVGNLLSLELEDSYLPCVSFVQHVPMIVAYEQVAIVSRKPAEIHWNADRTVLHNESGPSVRFRDGWCIWTIDGVQVNEQIVLHPDLQKIDEIHGEKNEEVRRIRIERFGWNRYLEESGAKVVDTRRNDIENTFEILARTEIGLRLITFCPSTGRRYALAIGESKIKTCAAAQKWLWGGKGFRILART